MLASRDSLLPASCMAAMAEAAVAPPVVPPEDTSRLPVVSFSSSILLFSTVTYIPSRLLERTGSMLS